MLSSHLLTQEPLKIISGLCITTEQNNEVVSGDNDLNEIINQKITIEILEELKKMGMELKIATSWQENLFPLVDLFYKMFKDEIKKTYVIGDLISFVRSIGEQTYIEFTQATFLKCFKARKKIAKGEAKIV